MSIGHVKKQWYILPPTWLGLGIYRLVTILLFTTYVVVPIKILAAPLPN
jgi:hypothetical protein